MFLDMAVVAVGVAVAVILGAALFAVGRRDLSDERLKTWIGLLKFMLGTVVLRLITAIINREIQGRELALREQEHLATFTKHALDKNVQTRLLLAQFWARDIRKICGSGRDQAARSSLFSI